MNLQEFAALKVGDRIENPMTQSTGTVTETAQQGVRVRWGGESANLTFFYPGMASTAWMHWSKGA